MNQALLLFKILTVPDFLADLRDVLAAIPGDPLVEEGRTTLRESPIFIPSLGLRCDYLVHTITIPPVLGPRGAVLVPAIDRGLHCDFLMSEVPGQASSLETTAELFAAYFRRLSSVVTDTPAEVLTRFERAAAARVRTTARGISLLEVHPASPKHQFAGVELETRPPTRSRRGTGQAEV